MICLDTSRYKSSGLEKLYFDTVWDILYTSKERYTNRKPDRSTNKSEEEGLVNNTGEDCDARISQAIDLYEMLKIMERYEINKKLGINFSEIGDPTICNTHTGEISEETKEEYETKLKRAYQKLILADFQTIRSVCCSLKEKNDRYTGNNLDIKKIYEKSKPFFRRICNRMVPDIEDGFNRFNVNRSKVHMNIRIVKTLGIRTCPYCNKEYIGNRGREVMGATLDHFFSRREYPFFSLSLYNLIPSCNTCNTVKNDKNTENMIAPFDNVKIDEYIKFEYDMLNDKVSICLDTSQAKQDQDAKSDWKRANDTIKALKLEEAYSFHSLEAELFLDRLTCYNTSQLLEIRDFLASKNVDRSVDDLRERAIEIVYGFQINSKRTGEQPLSKLYRDLYKGYEIGKYRDWILHKKRR